jgi:magnesium transporter
MQETDVPRKGAWIFSYDLNQEEVQQLVELGFDEALLEDAHDAFEVPRFEYVDGINYLFTRTVVPAKGGELSTAPLMIAISDEHILTVSRTQLDLFTPLIKGGNSELITTQKVRSVISIIEHIATAYERSIMTIRRTMLRHFRSVEYIDQNDIKEFVALESRLADYSSALVPMENALIQMLRRKRTLELHDDDIDYVEDLVQDVNQLIDSARVVSKTIESVRNAHSSILANKLNTTMKRLTAVTIVLTIPTIIASIFGMNVTLPLNNHPFAFPVLIIVIVILSLLVARWFSKSRWI